MDIKIIKTEKIGDIECSVDQFNNRWINNLAELKLSGLPISENLVKMVGIVGTGAIIVQLAIKDCELLPVLKDAGFKHLYTPPTGDYTQWWIKGDSTMGDPLTSISGAFGIIIKENKVLLVADKGRPVITLPGGSLNFNELPHDCVLREVSEEVGLGLGVDGDTGVITRQLISTVFRINSNRYGANDSFHYYMLSGFNSYDIKLQSSELLWADFVDINEALSQEFIDMGLHGKKKLSGITREVLEHIVKHPTERMSIQTYDLRQNSKPVDKKDKTDIMHIELYPITGSSLKKF